MRAPVPYCGRAPSWGGKPACACWSRRLAPTGRPAPCAASTGLAAPVPSPLSRSVPTPCTRGTMRRRGRPSGSTNLGTHLGWRGIWCRRPAPASPHRGSWPDTCTITGGCQRMWCGTSMHTGGGLPGDIMDGNTGPARATVIGRATVGRLLDMGYPVDLRQSGPLDLDAFNAGAAQPAAATASEYLSGHRREHALRSGTSR